MKRSKTSLLLMEQLVTLLVFALAAAVCLQVFVKADSLSREMEARDKAAVICQNAAETIQHRGGDLEAALTQMSGAPAGWRDGFGYFVSYDENGAPLPDDGSKTATHTLQAQEMDSGVPGLGKAQITYYQWNRGTMEELFTLETAWQEVDGHG